MSPGPDASMCRRRLAADRAGYAALIDRSWWAILLLLAVGVVLLGHHAPDPRGRGGRRRCSTRRPDLAYYDASRSAWGSDEYAIVCASGRDWVSPEGAKDLRALVADLAAVPSAASVVSLLDVPLLRQADGTSFDLSKLRTLKDDGVDFARAKQELLGPEIAIGNLLAPDGRATSILVYLQGAPGTAAPAPGGATAAPPDAALQTERRNALVAGVRKVAATWGARLGEPVRLSGICVINVNLVEHLRHDLRVFGLAALGFFLLTFLAIYRRWMFVALPLLVSALPVVLIVGAMAASGMKITIITSSLPLLLFVLLLPYTVYFVEAYRERQLLSPQEPGILSSVKAATAIFLPCLLSCTTTMAGFAALRTSLTRPVRDFGVMLAIGMAVGLVVVFLAIPAMARPLRKPRPPRTDGRGDPSGVVRLLANLSLRHPVAVIVVAALVLGVSVLGASKLSAQSKFTSYFRAESEVYKGLEYVDTKMGGTTPLEIHMKAPTKGFFLTPKGIRGGGG
jgi:hypothetical protein